MVVNKREEELELLRGCLENDRRSQKQLYKIYFKTMFHICLSYSGDRVEAKDILQEAFIKVFTNLENFNSKNSLEGWISVSLPTLPLITLGKEKGSYFRMSSLMNRTKKKGELSRFRTFQMTLFFITSNSSPTGQGLYSIFMLSMGYPIKKLQ